MPEGRELELSDSQPIILSRKNKPLGHKSGPSVWQTLGLEWRTLLILALIQCCVVLLVFIYIRASQMRLLEQTALSNAELVVDALAEFRTLYTSEVVNTASAHGLMVSHDYAQRDGAIPLPATLTILLGQRVDASGKGASVRLYSAYPFPWRDNLLDEGSFAQEAWKGLRALPDQPFFRFAEEDGDRVLRYAIADRMRPACVGCHNSHPQTPKADWNAGDVRGVLEVSFSLGASEGVIRRGERDALALLAALGGLGTLGLGLVFGRFRRTEAVLSKRVERRTQALVEANRVQRDFLANMSHEIRTPMTGILGMTRLLAESEPDDPERGIYLHQLDSSARGLLEVLDDILDLSTLEAGKLHLKKTPFRLVDPAESVMELFRAPAAEKNLKLDLQIAGDVPEWVAGDPGRLRQVLLNLVGNALKFTLEGAVVLRIEGISEQGIRWTVRDTGIGVGSQELPFIFKPFHQVDTSTSRHYEGTGLGLAICQRLVQLMDGKIGVDSAADEGSTFWFTLPLEAVDPPSEVAEPEEGQTWRGRVLVVEDNPVNLIVATSQLSAMGLTVDAVTDGEKALAAVARQDYDLVFMDCQMPGLDGYATTQQIRHGESTGEHLPIVALTAHALTEDRERCLAAGMDDHLPKPPSDEALEEILDRWLGGRNT